MELFDLSRRVALVTGGNGGIGLGMAEGLAAAGAAVMIAGRNRVKNTAAVATLRRAGATAEMITADVAQENSCRAMVSTTVAALGRLDILINNAGIGVGKRPENLAAVADLPGDWIDTVHQRRLLKMIVLDMDSSESPTYGTEEGSAYNGHFGCTCYHPIFVFDQLGDLERCALRSGNVHSAADWRNVLEPVVARYRGTVKRCYFRGDAAFANPEIYEFLEAEGYGYAIRLPTNSVLQGKIGHLLKRPVGRPPQEVRRLFPTFSYRAQSWNKPRHVVAKVEWHPGELYPRVGFIVSNLPRSPEGVVAFYNQRGTCEQHIKEGKNAIKWTRLSCHTFAANAVRLQLHVLAYNLGNFMRTLAMPKTADPWSLTSLREKLVKIGAKVVSHGRCATFQMSEVAVPRQMFADILALIARLRTPPAPA